MAFRINNGNILLIAIYLFFIFCLSKPCSAGPVKKDYPILKKYIIDYNTKNLDSASDADSYRGEEGILRIRPDVARGLGMKVYIDDNYIKSQKYFKTAEEALENAKKIMGYTGKDKSNKSIIQKMIKSMLVYKENELRAQESLKQYKANLDKVNDERFNHDICEKVIDLLLNECFKVTNNNLREGLGLFYNRCHGVDSNSDWITTDNVCFVNYVFNGFVHEASKKDISRFDVDRNSRNGNHPVNGSWKRIARKDFPKLLPVIETSIKKIGREIYHIDPLLFISLIKRESDFNPLAVSSVGAVGLTQIMPGTARRLGLKNIYLPEYFNEAGRLLKKERGYQKKAQETLLLINKKEAIKYAKEARRLMLKSIKAGEERERLFSRYKKELIKNKSDDRLKPKKAIEFGLVYFAKLMKAQDGDISLALASYNAGPHRVKQYNGIPPYDETVGFRNRIIRYYNQYLKMINVK